MGPSYLSSQFEFVHDYHSYKTRNHTTNTLVVPKFNSNAGLHTFHVRAVWAAHAWNNLSPIVRTELDSITKLVNLNQKFNKLNECCFHHVRIYLYNTVYKVYCKILYIGPIVL